jgi:preprotein translocase subunit SecD
MRKTGPILILLIGVLALVIDFFPGLTLPDSASADGTWRPVVTKLGLDLEGGLRVEYQAIPVDGVSPGAGDMSVIKDIVERRVNQTGVSEPIVLTQGADRVVVELPGVTDPESVRRLVGQTGRLDFVPLGQQQVQDGQTLDLEANPPLFSGDQVQSATVGTDQNGRPAVDFVLKGDGAKLFGDYTATHVGEFFAITLDKVVISAPTIQSAIPDGRGQITGGTAGFPIKEAQNLVTVLKFGSLPFPIQELSSEQISATLGSQFLGQSLLAGLIGIGLVVTFMLTYYRLTGLVASFALIYYTLVMYALFRLIPVTLTLAGVAGFVLSIGMAVDANILIFERMREELRAGRSLGSAIEAGFTRAWSSIWDSNVSTWITCAILFWFGTGLIKGFALTLAIGVLVSMFTAITVTRTFLRALVATGVPLSPALFGVRVPSREPATPPPSGGAAQPVGA